MSFSEFARAIFANPRKVGTFCPSSSRLADSIAKQLPLPESGIVVELGGGTGAITKGLLKKEGFSPQKLFVVERDERLADFLRQEFPKVHVISGDACELKSLLAPFNVKVDHIVSSLPMRFLPKKVVEQVTIQVDQLLPQNGRFIQYTYRLNSEPLKLPGSWERVASKITFVNFPPAKIEVYQRKS